MRYAIICQESWQINEFTDRVNAMLEKGWKLYEETFPLVEDGTTYLCQVVVYEKGEEK